MQDDPVTEFQMKSLILLLIFLPLICYSQSKWDEANTIIQNKSLQADQVNTWWTDLNQSNSIPIVHNDSVLFLYRGNADTVEWMGDFNGWGYVKEFP
jgi:hypothetical protein